MGRSIKSTPTIIKRDPTSTSSWKRSHTGAVNTFISLERDIIETAAADASCVGNENDFILVFPKTGNGDRRPLQPRNSKNNPFTTHFSISHDILCPSTSKSSSCDSDTSCQVKRSFPFLLPRRPLFAEESPPFDSPSTFKLNVSQDSPCIEPWSTPRSSPSLLTLAMDEIDSKLYLPEF